MYRRPWSTVAGNSTGHVAGINCVRLFPTNPTLDNGCAGKQLWKKCMPITLYPAFFGASPSLITFNAAVHDAIPTLDGEFCTPTFFSFFAGHLKQAFSLAESIALYQALNRNFTPPILAASGTCARQSATCHSHVGQPVPMGCRDRAVLRISSSARLVTRCWSPDPVVAAARIEDEITKVQAVIEKVSLLAQYVDAAAA